MRLLQEILVYIFLVVGTMNFLHLGLFVIGANVYDIKVARQKKTSKAKEFLNQYSWWLHNRLRGANPSYGKVVTVVIPAHNEELAIEQCLQSIYDNTYRHVEVIVHDDKSTDSTAKIVRAFKRAHPDMQLRLVSRRRNVGKGAGLNYCITKYARGQLIMTLDADCLLEAHAIQNAVAYFDDKSVLGVAANVKLLETPTVLGLLQRFEHMIGYRSKKFYTLTNCEIIVGGVASTYRAEVLKAVKFYDTDTQTEDIGLSMKIISRYGKAGRIVYAADVLAMTEPVQTFKDLLKQRYRWKLGMIQNLFKYRNLVGNASGKYQKMLTIYRMPVAFLSEVALLLEPIILGYVLYISISQQTGVLFIGAYITITAYVLSNIWPDEHLTPRQKLTQSMYAPLMYFVFYVMDVVQIVAIFRVVAKPHKVLRRGYVESSWVSPTRAARTAA